MRTTLIIGAGLSGLIAANELQKAGHDVTLLEKSRGVGGRLATWTLEECPGARFDYGAQFFTTRSEEFKAAVKEWEEAGIVQRWFEGFPSPNSPKPEDTYPRYKATEGMAGIAEFLVEGLKLQLDEKVMAASHDEGGWKVSCQSGEAYEADNLLLTAPIPQSLALLDAGGIELPNDVREPLESVVYQPCFAVMVTLDGPSKIPSPGALFLEGEPISWMADNFQKGVASREGEVTIHSTGKFARDYFESDADTVVHALIEAAQNYLGANVLSFQVRRWRYSKPQNPLVVGALGVKLLNLAFAGDGLCGAKVEGAFLSGLAAAQFLL